MREWFAKRTIGSLPAEAARRWGDREALMWRDKRWSHAAFDGEVDAVARALIAAGVGHGDRVALWIGNIPEFLFTFFAVIKIGAVVVPLNTRYRTHDLAYALRQSRVQTLVTVDRAGPVDYGAMVREVLGTTQASPGDELRAPSFPELRRVIWIASGELLGSRNWQEFLDAGAAVSDATLGERAAVVDPDAMAIIMYTSGTTGNPKGVMLDHSGIHIAVDRGLAFGMTTSDAQLNYLPLFHAFSIAVMVLGSVLYGCRQVLMETFDADEALRLVKTERITLVHGFDTHFRDLMEAKRRRNGPVDLSSLRVGLLAAGMDSSVPIALAAQKEICRTISGFGMTEVWATSAIGFLDSTEDQRCRGSGYPLPGVELRIIDPANGRDLPPDVQGEILVRGYANMLGYWDDPQATARTIDADGWLHTGDAGLIRPDGHLRFVGRYKDMLKVGGENVAPAEIEELLMQVPGVAQIAVVGVPDPRLTEVAVAFVVRQDGIALDEGALIGFCRGKIASYKIPRRAVFVDALPMTASGKVQKEKLRQSLR